MLVFYNNIIIMVEILIMYCSQTAEHLIKESGCILEHAAACLMPLSTIFQLYRAVSFIGGENHRPVASH
jgi:hypothetical protein